MQPKAPPNYRPAIVDRLGINSRLPVPLRMILRNIERRLATPGVTVLGVALATGLLVVGQGMFDGTTRMLSVQFDAIERDDVTLTFDQLRAWHALLDVRHLAGVIRAEPFRSVAARLRAGQRLYRIAIMGMRQDDDLRGIFDAQGRRIALPAGGILLSATVACLLRAIPSKWKLCKGVGNAFRHGSGRSWNSRSALRPRCNSMNSTGRWAKRDSTAFSNERQRLRE
jgi:putative ABC transport system permease protein